jgi:hypothetical protein
METLLNFGCHETRAISLNSSTTTGSAINAFARLDFFARSLAINAQRLLACCFVLGDSKSSIIEPFTSYTPEGIGFKSPPLQTIASNSAISYHESFSLLTIISLRNGNCSVTDLNHFNSSEEC